MSALVNHILKRKCLSSIPGFSSSVDWKMNMTVQASSSHADENIQRTKQNEPESQDGLMKQNCPTSLGELTSDNDRKEK